MSRTGEVRLFAFGAHPLLHHRTWRGLQRQQRFIRRGRAHVTGCGGGDGTVGGRASVIGVYACQVKGTDTRGRRWGRAAAAVRQLRVGELHRFHRVWPWLGLKLRMKESRLVSRLLLLLLL